MSPTETKTLVATVDEVIEGADGIRILVLKHPDGKQFPAWVPGAHIDVIINDEITRQYSLCGDPADLSTLRIGVLREPESRGGSEFIHSNVVAGQSLHISEPKNNFAFAPKGKFLFIAGGIGITPLLPMVKECEQQGVEWRMVYGGRSLASMAFKDELEVFGDKVTFWPQDEFGHLDLPALLDNPDANTLVYCCGPGPLLDAVEAKFASLDESLSCELHVERFRAKASNLEGENTPFTLILDYSDIEVEVPANMTVLDAIKACGVQVPSSCREGTCGTCETVVLDGIPDHRDSYLTEAEKASNEVMTPCCSRSKTPVLILDL